MCGDCVEKEYPNRCNTCLENGPFSLNFTGYAVCNKQDFMLITNKSLKEEDGEEIVTYDHLCKNCHHVVAWHEYTFSIMNEFQEYTMLCLLCGKAEDTISILPDDPQQRTVILRLLLQVCYDCVGLVYNTASLIVYLIKKISIRELSQN